MFIYENATINFQHAHQTKRGGILKWGYLYFDQLLKFSETIMWKWQFPDKQITIQNMLVTKQ